MQNLPEIWGGIECTINRVKDTFIDQLDVSGHYARETDIDLVASLGIKSLRFPILWERHEAAKGQVIDWSWSEKSLNKLQQHGISPIVGLVHHGSGPAYTSLQNESFAPGLAAYAAKVAKKYPHIEYYIPVNEPLTTARFSGLYGFWYPHGNSDQDFCFMLINQVKATVLAMQEIRKINPSAKLVQTEDLAKTYSVPSLQYQADFENDRRWISFDLLCGKVNRQHPLWDFFIRAGISEDSLKFFTGNPCPPDILGLNYYVTSERFLDDDLDRYPPHMHGGNWIDRYVDVEAVRVNHGQPSGLRLLINEAQERYGLPMAITECHLNLYGRRKNALVLGGMERMLRPE
jgi:dTDP-4-dehydrorhamnose reductase